MAVDVVTAEAVVAFAAGAVTKFEIGIFGVGATAYGAFAGIGLTLTFGSGLARGLLEIDHILPSGTVIVSADLMQTVQQHIAA